MPIDCRLATEEAPLPEGLPPPVPEALPAAEHSMLTVALGRTGFGMAMTFTTAGAGIDIGPVSVAR